MKMTKQDTLYHKAHGATLKHKCGKKDSSISPFYFIFWASFFVLSPFFLFMGQCSINDEHHSSIYLHLNDYKPILEQVMALYECLRRCTWMCNDSWVTCMKELWMVALPQIRSQLHDHAKQYDNDEACHNKWDGGKLHGNISRNGYGKVWWLFCGS